MKDKQQDKILEEAEKELQKFIKSDLKRATRLTGPQLANEYNKLLEENEELKETNKKFKERIEDLLMRVDITKGTEEQLRRKIEKEEKVGRERQANGKKRFDNEVSLHKYGEDTANEFKSVLEEKEAIIKIQSMNNRVLLEEIIRAREGKK